MFVCFFFPVFLFAHFNIQKQFYRFIFFTGSLFTVNIRIKMAYGRVSTKYQQRWCGVQRLWKKENRGDKSSMWPLPTRDTDFIKAKLFFCYVFPPPNLTQIKRHSNSHPTASWGLRNMIGIIRDLMLPVNINTWTDKLNFDALTIFLGELKRSRSLILKILREKGEGYMCMVLVEGEGREKGLKEEWRLQTQLFHVQLLFCFSQMLRI